MKKQSRYVGTLGSQFISFWFSVSIQPILSSGPAEMLKRVQLLFLMNAEEAIDFESWGYGEPDFAFALTSVRSPCCLRFWCGTSRVKLMYSRQMLLFSRHVNPIMSRRSETISIKFCTWLQRNTEAHDYLV